MDLFSEDALRRVRSNCMNYTAGSLLHVLDRGMVISQDQIVFHTLSAGNLDIVRYESLGAIDDELLADHEPEQQVSLSKVPMEPRTALQKRLAQIADQHGSDQGFNS